MTAIVSFIALVLAIAYNNDVIGSGGWATGADVADDGTIVERNDTTGPTIRGPVATVWSRMFKPGINMMDASLLDLRYGGGSNNTYDPSTYDVAICATDSTKSYFVVMGYVWKWSSGTVTRTSSTQFADCLGNSGDRMANKPLAVDPQNAAVVFFGAPDGLHISANSGATWTDVSTGTIPVPTAGQRMSVVFDRHSAVSGGKTQGIYVFVPGSGLYHSANGGTTWANIASCPVTSISCMRVSPDDGYVHIAGSAALNAQYRRFDGVSTWTAPSGVTGKAIALSTLNAGRMWLCGEDGRLQVSTDNGVTFSAGAGAPLRVDTEIPWRATTIETYMSNGDLQFNPITGALWMFEGIGAWKLDSPPTTISANVTWTGASVGIENMVSITAQTAPNGNLLYACEDRGAFVIPRASVGVTYPSANAGVPTGHSITHGGMVDYAPEDNAFSTVCLKDYAGETSADTGASWVENAGMIGGGEAQGGNIIAFSATNWVQQQTNNGSLQRTTDAGATWTQCTIGNNLDGVAHQSYTLAKRILVKDQFVAGQAYLYHIGSGDGGTDDLACKGIWKTTNYGVTWARVKNGYIINHNADYYNGKLTQVGADDWLWCGGDAAEGLWRSTDGMVTWAQITGSDNVYGAASFSDVLAVGVGAAFPGSTHKTMLVSGFRMVTPSHPSDYTGFGLWASVDNGDNWWLIDQFPNGYFSATADIAGDPTIPGLFYYGMPGEGLMKIQVSVS